MTTPHPNDRATPGERRLLQAAVILAACVPVLGGLSGVVLGSKLLGANAPDPVSLDSHVRYLSGLLLGIGLAFWWLVPNIEKATEPFRLMTFLVFLGGLARLAGIMVSGIPSPVMLFALPMELAVTPFLCAWQTSLARRSE